MESDNQFKIAVVGISGVFPSANSIAELWEGIINKTIFVEKFDKDSSESSINSSFLPFNGILKNADCFDYDFFKIQKEQAIEIDPQQRIFLEVVYNALRDAGIDPENLPTNNIGIYASSSNPSYEQFLRGSDTNGVDFVRTTGLMRDLISSRISYYLNLHGPAVNVQTGCSSSMTAIYEAVKALLHEECSVAIAGSSSVRFPQNRGHYHFEGGIYSNDGFCRPFDAKSSGTVSGNGCAAVILKRYEDAISDGDRIYFLVNSMLGNNDGYRKASIAAPSVEGQRELLSEVIEIAEISPSQLQFVETHGTATQLGDLVEFSALNSVLSGESGNEIAIGSIKANIGHLDATSGISGFIKAGLSLYKRKFPPHPLFTRYNPLLEFDKSNLFVNSEVLELNKDEKIYAGVNSLGIGGTNIFAVLESHGGQTTKEKTTELIIPVNFKHTDQIEQWKSSIQRFVEFSPKDVNRLHCTLDREGYLTSGIYANNKSGNWEFQSSSNHIASPVNKLAFIFPGGGTHKNGCLLQACRYSAVIKEAVLECFSCLPEGEIKNRVEELIFSDLDEQTYESYTSNLAVNFLFTFIVNHSVGTYLFKSSITPWLMMGHSLGEYNALVFSNVIQLNDAIEIIQKRSEILSEIQGFIVMNVNCSPDRIANLCEEFELIAINSSANVTVLIEQQNLHSLTSLLEKDGILYSVVPIDCAPHSSYLEPFLDGFNNFLSQYNYHSMKHGVISNVTGLRLDDDMSFPDYLTKHLRNTVQFEKSIQYCKEEQIDTFVQVGQGSGLLYFTPNTSNRLTTIQSDESKQHVDLMICEYLLKYRPSSERLNAPSPAYPFQKLKCWPNEHVVRHVTQEDTKFYVENEVTVGSVNCSNPTEADIAMGFEELVLSKAYGVISWNKSISDPREIADLVQNLCKLDEQLSAEKDLFLIRDLSEPLEALLPLRSVITSFNIETKYLRVKLLSVNESELGHIDFQQLHEEVQDYGAKRIEGKKMLAPLFSQLYTERIKADSCSGFDEISIIGGTGRVGLQMAAMLIENGCLSVEIVSRSSEGLNKISSLLALSSQLESGRIKLTSLDSFLNDSKRSHSKKTALLFCASASEKDSIRTALQDVTLHEFLEQMDPKSALYDQIANGALSSKFSHIVFFSSNASRLSGPTMLPYAYANALTEVIRAETSIHSSISFDAVRFSNDLNQRNAVENFVDENDLFQALTYLLSSSIEMNLILSRTNFTNRHKTWVEKKVDLADNTMEMPAQNESVHEGVLRIFRRVLGNEDLTDEQSFFESGVNSLLAFRAIAQINKSYNCRISMKSLKQYSTAKMIADHLIENITIVDEPDDSSSGVHFLDDLLDSI